MSAHGRIQQTLGQLKAQGRKALIPYMTAGDPDPSATVALMHALVEGGADVRAEVTFRVSFGGKLLGRPKSSEAGTKDPMVRVASERAIRAVYAAEPFNDFPPELYGEELIYPFDAPAACAR